MATSVYPASVLACAASLENFPRRDASFRRVQTKWWVVTVKPGDVIVHNGESLKVVGVSVYRALAVDGGYEIVG